eukprot:157474_1
MPHFIKILKKLKLTRKSNIIILMILCITAIIYIILADVLIFRNNSSSIDYFKSTILVNISSINTTYIQLNITTPHNYSNITDIHLKQKSQIRHVRKNAIVHGIPAICKLLPLKTCMLIHHKTGHDLSWSIRDVFEKYCHKKKNKGRTNLI